MLVTQLSHVQLCNPMACCPPGSSVHGILQARTLERVAFAFSRGFSWPRDWTQVSHMAGRFFTFWATREAHCTERTSVFFPTLTYISLLPSAYLWKSPCPIVLSQFLAFLFLTEMILIDVEGEQGSVEYEKKKTLLYYLNVILVTF